MRAPDPPSNPHDEGPVRRHDTGEHPSPEHIVRYRAERLGAADQERVRAHLLACAECRALLLELAELEHDPDAGRADLSDTALDQAWREQQHRQAPTPAVAPRRPARHRVIEALAAVLGVAVLGLGWTVRTLDREREALYRDSVPSVVALEQSQRSAGAELPVMPLDADRPGLVILVRPQGRAFTAYRATFFAEDGRQIDTRAPLTAHDYLLTIPMRPGVLPPGEIRVTLAGRGVSGWIPIETYALRVHRP